MTPFWRVYIEHDWWLQTRSLESGNPPAAVADLPLGPSSTRRLLRHLDDFHRRLLQAGNRPYCRLFLVSRDVGSRKSSLLLLTTLIGSDWYPSLSLVPLRPSLPLVPPFRLRQTLTCFF